MIIYIVNQNEYINFMFVDYTSIELELDIEIKRYLKLKKQFNFIMPKFNNLESSIK